MLKPKKTEVKNLKKTSSKIQNWEENLRKILTNNLTDEESQFFLEYCLNICQLRLAVMNSKDTQFFLREIDSLLKVKDKASSLGISQERLEVINRMFRDLQYDQLQKILKELQIKKKGR